VANGQLLKQGPFDYVWIQPAAGDAGGALGCALWWWYQVLGSSRKCDHPDSMQGAFLGFDIPSSSQRDDSILNRLGATWEYLSEEKLQKSIAAAIAEQKIVAIARGKAEFGPRALGNRSIVADARNAIMQKHLNLKVKFRESFRPFAPMVLQEDASEYFEIFHDSPYMLFCYPVAPQHRCVIHNDVTFGMDRLKQPHSDIPTVTHIDYSARVQTVDSVRNPFMHGVLSEFKKTTGCPVIVNTSFNVRGEPIVNTAEDAYRCFMVTQIDCLVVGNRFLKREKQNRRPLNDQQCAEWLQRFDLD
jgi:carbamoyltransferase